MSRSHSTAEVARILGMREARVRELVRSGLCRPAHRGRRYAFSFQDLVVLRAAQGLLEEGIPAARVQRSLAAVVHGLPSRRPLSGLRIYAAGRDVVVCAEGASWQPETGQLLLRFDVEELAARVDEVRSEPVREPTAAGCVATSQARIAFERALELDEDDPKAAADAYRRAIELTPELVDAHVNLGRIVHEQGDAPAAQKLYLAALERCPDDPVIHFNLALALEDGHGREDAIRHYRRAVELDPSFADAHFNLAGLCEQLGRRADAIRHYGAYKKLIEV